MTHSLQATVVPVTPFQQNCSLLWCSETLKAAAVDPGGDLDRIDAAIEKAGVTLEKILITPGHVAEFLLLNDQFPRSLNHCLRHAQASLERIVNPG